MAPGPKKKFAYTPRSKGVCKVTSMQGDTNRQRHDPRNHHRLNLHDVGVVEPGQYEQFIPQRLQPRHPDAVLLQSALPSDPTPATWSAGHRGEGPGDHSPLCKAPRNCSSREPHHIHCGKRLFAFPHTRARGSEVRFCLLFLYSHKKNCLQENIPLKIDTQSLSTSHCSKPRSLHQKVHMKTQ